MFMTYILYVTCFIFLFFSLFLSLFETTYQPNFTFIICIYSLVQPPTRHEHLDDILDIDHLLYFRVESQCVEAKERKKIIWDFSKHFVCGLALARNWFYYLFWNDMVGGQSIWQYCIFLYLLCFFNTVFLWSVGIGTH